MTLPPQPMHIFRKDLLHLWPETLVVVLLFVAFAWAAPSGWVSSQYATAAVLLSGFLKVILMPISWLVVISRLIQDEPLVGDRQFWTSRPYHWASLLAAKLLYLLVFLYLPFFLMQVYLLKHAGLYPMLALPALFRNLLFLTVIIVVPLAAIASVTATFARMLLTTVGAVIYLIIVSLAVVYLLFRRMPPPGLTYLLIALFILLPLGTLVYQYATRRTTVSRILLAGTPLVIVLLLLLVPATALIRSHYPAAGASGPQLTTLPEQLLPKTTPPGALRVEGGYVQLGLPIAVSGIDPKSNYVVKGVSLTVEAPGYHWSSPFLNDLGNELNAYNPVALIPVILPLSVFDRVHTQPASVRLTLATDHIQAADPATWKTSLQPFSVPGHGVCSYSATDPDALPLCRYPLAVPDINLAAARLTAGSCSDPAAPKTERRANLQPQLPSTLDFDPVITVPLVFRAPAQEAPQPLFLCPGTPLQFVQARSTGSTRLEVTLPGLILDRYASRISDRSRQPPAPDQPANEAPN